MNNDDEDAPYYSRAWRGCHGGVVRNEMRASVQTGRVAVEARQRRMNAEMGRGSSRPLTLRVWRAHRRNGSTLPQQRVCGVLLRTCMQFFGSMSDEDSRFLVEGRPLTSGFCWVFFTN